MNIEVLRGRLRRRRRVPLNWWHVILLLAVVSLIVLASIWGQQPPAPRGLEASPEVFSARQAKVELQNMLKGEEPHPLGSSDHDRIRQYLLDRLTDLGYDPHVQEALVSNPRGDIAMVRNILARLEGESREAVMLTCHYDSVPAGPGASDDAAQVAVLLQVAEIMRNLPKPKNSVIFHMSDGEELGLLGARAFARRHAWGPDVKMVINLEMRGTAGPALMFETGPNNLALVEAFGKVVDRPVSSSLFSTLYEQLPNSTDFYIYKKHGMTGLNFASVGRTIHYHSPMDNLASVSLNALQHHGDNALALTRYFASADLNRFSSARGDAVFFDVFGRILVHYPQEWALPLAIAVLVLAIPGLLRIYRFEQRPVKAVLLGALAWVLAAASGGLVAYGFMLGAKAVGGELATLFMAYPTVRMAALTATALGAAGAVLALFGRLAGPTGLWAGSALVWSLLNLGMSYLLPGVSYLFLLPALGLVLGLLVVTIWPLPVPAGGWLLGILVALIPGTVVWAPLLTSLPLFAGPLQPFVFLPALVMLTLIIPLFGEMRGSVRWSLPPAFLAAAVVLIVLAVKLPLFTEELPGYSLIAYRYDVNENKAEWLLPKWAPGEVLEAIGEEVGEGQVGHAVDLTFSEGLSAPAPLVPLTPAEVVVREDEELPAGAGGEARRRLNLYIASQLPARQMWIAFPPEVELRALQIGPVEISKSRLKNTEGEWHRYRLIGPQLTGGIGVILEVPVDSPVRVIVTEQSDGLPGAGEKLLQVTPPTRVPINEGNVTLVEREYEF